MTAVRASDPKRRVLNHLKRSGPTTTQDVARALGVSDVAARQHLSVLESRGLVNRAEQPPAGKGRPNSLWSLTALANDLFPDRHDALTVELIAGIRSTLGEDGLQRVIQARTRNQLETLQKRIKRNSPLRERLRELAEQRALEGYMAEVVEDGGAWLLVEHHCPICDAAQACQQFCSTELELFQEALGPDAEVVREQHLLSGNARCVYRVTQRRQD